MLQQYLAWDRVNQISIFIISATLFGTRSIAKFDIRLSHKKPFYSLVPIYSRCYTGQSELKYLLETWINLDRQLSEKCLVHIHTSGENLSMRMKRRYVRNILKI